MLFRWRLREERLRLANRGLCAVSYRVVNWASIAIADGFALDRFRQLGDLLCGFCEELR